MNAITSIEIEAFADRALALKEAEIAAADCAVESPVIVAYGMGVDSTAVLVGMKQEGIRPDLIMFADTGDEKPQTYAYLAIINAWLRKVGFPEVTVVKNARPKSGDKSLSDACLRTGVLPALAYGMHQCSIVWKLVPQQKYVKQWQPAINAWARGKTVMNLIGYDNGPRDNRRQYKAEGKAADGYTNGFMLIAWGWDREECERQILSEGLPLPVKSACFHCPASKKHEILELRETSPEQAAKAVLMEQTAKARGLKRIEGLGRRFSWEALYAEAV